MSKPANFNCFFDMKPNERTNLSEKDCNYIDFFLRKALSVPSWSIDIRQLLISLFSIAVSLNAKNILEIGVREGYSTLALNLAVGLTEGKLISVDIEGYRLKHKLPFEERWKFIQSDSLVFLRGLQKHKPLFDMVFIDGAHTYNQVKQEFNIIAEHVNKSGLILFHDTMPGTCPEYSSGEANQPDGFLGGGPFKVISELDKSIWECCTIPVSHGLTIVRKY